jgi:hypothetical protein
MKMKRINKLFMVFAGLVVSIVACKDEDLQIVPEWESGIHTDITIATGSASNFVYKGTAPIGVDFLWNSIDSKNTVTKIEFYIQFNEPYIDTDGNPAVAKHGGSKGLLIKTLEGGAVPANRTKAGVTFTQAEVFALYQNATFDYDKDGTKTPVFANPAHADRTVDGRFVKGDQFQIKWNVYTEDGRVFDSWSPSVCAEFPNAACLFDWGVICTSALAGTYNVTSTFTSPGYFDSVNPDFQYGPGNDGSVANGVQKYNGIVVTAGTATSTYDIPDITNGFEPIMWGNVKVRAIVADQCGTLVLVSLVTKPYAYTIEPGSQVNADGSLTINWKNVYGEFGTSTFVKP